MKTTQLDIITQEILSNYNKEVEEFKKQKQEDAVRKLALSIASSQDFQKELQNAVAHDLKLDLNSGRKDSSEGFQNFINKFFPKISNTTEYQELTAEMKDRYFHYKDLVRGVDLTNVNSSEYLINLLGVAVRTACGLLTPIIYAQKFNFFDQNGKARELNEVLPIFAMSTCLAICTSYFAAYKNIQLSDSKSKIADSFVKATLEVNDIAKQLDIKHSTSNNSQNCTPAHHNKSQSLV